MRRPEDNSDKGDEKPKQKPENVEFLHIKDTYEMVKYDLFIYLFIYLFQFLRVGRELNASVRVEAPQWSPAFWSYSHPD